MEKITGISIPLLGLLLWCPWLTAFAIECDSAVKVTVEHDTHTAASNIELDPLWVRQTNTRLNPTLLNRQPWCNAFKPLSEFDEAELRGGDIFWMRLDLNFMQTSPDAWLLNFSNLNLNRVCSHLPLVNAGYVRRCAGLAVNRDDWPLGLIKPAFPLPYQLDFDRPILVEVQAQHPDHSCSALDPIAWLRRFGASAI